MGGKEKCRMKPYSQNVKEAMVAKLCSIGGPKPVLLAQETGICYGTLTRWKRELGEDLSLKNKRSKDMSVKEKIKILFETENLEENELGIYLRTKGIHSHDLDEWKQSLKSPSAGRPRLDPEIVEFRKKVKDLEQELRRKDKALAETTARLILKKKMQELWGDPEEDE